MKKIRMVTETTFQVAWDDNDALIVDTGTTHFEYPKNAANQLILCARMNPWDRFMAMIEKKTESPVWAALGTYFTSLDKDAAWKVKEKFARLSTHEDE